MNRIRRNMSLLLAITVMLTMVFSMPIYGAATDSSNVEHLTAIPTSSKVLVNGTPTSFDAYTIKENNYFKLRDLAKVVSETEKQFEVQWDNSKQAINLTSKMPYTSVGGEMAVGDVTVKKPVLNTSKIYKDGVEIPLTAYTINGNNYFKLRDIAQAFDIGVTWDGPTNTIGIDTTISYVPVADKYGVSEYMELTDELINIRGSVYKTQPAKYEQGKLSADTIADAQKVIEKHDFNLTYADAEEFGPGVGAGILYYGDMEIKNVIFAGEDFSAVAVSEWYSDAFFENTMLELFRFFETNKEFADSIWSAMSMYYSGQVYLSEAFESNDLTLEPMDIGDETRVLFSIQHKNGSIAYLEIVSVDGTDIYFIGFGEL